MYNKVDSLDALFELIRQDKEANGPNYSTRDRYPIRFVLFDNFKDQYQFILRMIGERKVLQDSIHNWIDADYPDILITHVRLAKEIENLIKELNGEDRVITPFSEVARFYDNQQNKEFDTLIRTIKGIEGKDIAWVKHQRVYIPIVGLEAKMSTFKDDPQIFIWYMHTDDMANSQRLILTNQTNYGVKLGSKEYACVDDVASWIDFWKHEGEREKPNILCESGALYSYGDYAKPDNAFNICLCHNVYEFLTKGLQLNLVGIPYKEEDEDFWKEFACEVDLNTKFDFEKFVFKHFAVVDISSPAVFLKLWFEYNDKFSRWLLSNYYRRKYPNDIISRALGKVSLYMDLELLCNVALDITNEPEEMECRKYILNEAAARDKGLDDETVSKLVTKLEKVAEEEGYSSAIKLFTKITSREKELAVCWVGDGKIQAKEVKDFYPELFSYLQKTDAVVQNEAEWALDYIDKYKASKVADTILPEAREAILSANGNPVEFTKWYQRLKTTRSLLSARKDIDVFFWIDGLGIDWISLVSALVKEQNKNHTYLNEVLIARAILPSTTAINKEDFMKMIPESATFEKVGNIDAMAHSNKNTYPGYIVAEIAEVTSAIGKVIQKYAGKKVAIISDHGLSYLPQRATGLNLAGYEYHHFGRYATIKSGNPTTDSNYLTLEDGKTICSLNYDSVGNKINTGQGAHGGCTPEEALVPIFIISSSPSAKPWKATALIEEIVATNPVVKVKIVGLNPNDKPKLTYNGQVYALNCVESNVYESSPITNLDPAKNEFVVKVGESVEKLKININTGTTIEDQFADFF